MTLVSLSGSSKSKSKSSSKPIGLLQFLSGTSNIKVKISKPVVLEVERVDIIINFLDKNKHPIIDPCIGSTILSRPPPLRDGINSLPQLSSHIPSEKSPSKKCIYGSGPETLKEAI